MLWRINHLSRRFKKNRLLNLRQYHFQCSVAQSVFALLRYALHKSLMYLVLISYIDEHQNIISALKCEVEVRETKRETPEQDYKKCNFNH